MPRTKERMRHLNVYLLKDRCIEFEDALRDQMIAFKLRKVRRRGFEAALYLPVPPAKEPLWIQFLREGFGNDLEVDSNRVPSALLLVKVKGRLFALTFGHSRSLLDEDAIELDFGLRVVVNRVDAQRIRGINLRMFREMAVKRSEEASQGTGLRSFTVNVRQDLLRGLTGRSSDLEFANRLSGTDSLVVDLPLHFNDLGAKCNELLEAFEDKRYRKTGFKWIENIKEVRDQETIEWLDGILVTSLRSESGDVSMITPDSVTRDDISGFLYAGERGEDNLHAELEITDWYLANKTTIETIDADKLRERQIRVYDSDGGVERIREYDFFSFEHREQKESYILSNGRWYEIAQDLLKDIKDYMKHVERHALPLLPAQRDETEDSYLNRLIEAKKDLITMHKATYDMADGPIELCDVLSKRGHLVHVKRWTKSSTFSHLLRQGAVAADTLRSIPGARRHIRGKVTKFKTEISNLFPARNFSPSQLCVVFALIRQSQNDLPFFSTLSLMREGQQIESMGYKVVYQRIKVNEGIL